MMGRLRGIAKTIRATSTPWSPARSQPSGSIAAVPALSPIPGSITPSPEVEAFGTDGSYLQTIKRQPAIGVSGTEMFASTLRSVQKATANLQTLDFV